MKYLKRLLALPFLLAVSIIGLAWEIPKKAYRFIRFGGDVIVKEGEEAISPTKIMAEMRRLNKNLERQKSEQK